MKLAVITCLWQRPKVAGLMLGRLEQQGIPTIAVGSEGEASRFLAESHGARYVEERNNPLGAKWNRALMEARVLCPDGVVVLGSDNFVSDSLFVKWKKALEQGIEFIGVRDGYVYDLAEDRLVHWQGYKGRRSPEPLGSGRMYAKSLLDRMLWKLWDDDLERGLDGSATRRCLQHDAAMDSVWMSNADVIHLGVKTGTHMSSMPYGPDNMDPTIIDEWFGPAIRKGHEGGGGI